MKQCCTWVLCMMMGTAWAQPIDGWLTPFERSEELETATYEQAIAFYDTLAERFDEVQLIPWEVGRSDVGPPIHLVLLSGKAFDPTGPPTDGRPFILINNAIHPGEPCGVDASMMLARDLVQDSALRPLLDELVIGIIPVYNIGGALNRGCCSRANQDGPVTYGFRGNARNFDLNRDFIKTNSQNTRAFASIFQRYLPHLFVDTHTSNGADYKAVITLIETQPDKLGGQAAKYQTDQLVPALYAHMEQADIPMCPYVYSLGRTPDDKGIRFFMDLPRYSSGYTSLFHTMSFISEAHMLKPFEERVWGTYTLLTGMIEYAAAHGPAVVAAVEADRKAVKTQETYKLQWRLDTNRVDSLRFDGYEAVFEPSQVTGATRLRYDRSQPYQRNIPLFRHYQATRSVKPPKAYIIPQSYPEVIELLQLNGVELVRLTQDTLLIVEGYHIEDIHTYSFPYEGHYYHDEVRVYSTLTKAWCNKGDYVAFPNQASNAYLIHVLEPEASDSFFRWNYMDGILMQKEHFSAYVFEEKALELLESDPFLAKHFKQKKELDPEFAQDGYAQLEYIYRHSPYYEKKTHNQYPIFRYHGKADLPVR